MLFTLLLAPPYVVSANGNDMMQMGWSCGMMEGTGMFWMGLAGLIYITLGAFIFSLIFWLIYNWIAKK